MRYFVSLSLKYYFYDANYNNWAVPEVFEVGG